jgi:hypothetical protein
MPRSFHPLEKKFSAPSLCDLLNPIHAIPGGIPLLLTRGNKPLELSFEQQLNALVYFHLCYNASPWALQRVYWINPCL